MGEIFQSIFNEVAGNDKSTRDAAKLPVKTATALSLFAMTPSFH